jgi:predicted kinase
MLITELIAPVEEGVYDPHIFKAVFMAGSPGAGKSTIANKLFGGTGLKVLNVDSFWQLYKGLGKQGNYSRYWELYKVQEKNFLAGRLGLIIDGTAKNPERMAQVKADLESLGYDTAMVFVNTSLETSMNRVINRAKTSGKDLGREIDPQFVQDAWEKTQRGLGALQSMFGGNFFIIDNNRGEPNVAYAEKTLKRWLNKTPTNPSAREWMQAQLAAKSTAGKMNQRSDDAAPAQQNEIPAKSST